MPQCHNRIQSGGLNYSFCARIMPVAADGGQVMALFAVDAWCACVRVVDEYLQPLLNTDFIGNKATITEARHNNCWSKRQVQTNIWSDCTPASFLRVEAFLPPPEKSGLINKARVKWPPTGAFTDTKARGLLHQNNISEEDKSDKRPSVAPGVEFKRNLQMICQEKLGPGRIEQSKKKQK